MSSGIPASDRSEEPLERLFGSVFELAGQFVAQISKDDLEARLRWTLRQAPRPAVGQPPSALVSRAAAGDQEAWDQIVERYAPLVWAICRRYRLVGDDAEDVGQRVWLLLVEQIGALRDLAAMPGWLATTTSRECLRVLERARQAALLATPPQDPAQLADAATVDAETIDAEILATERNAALLAAFAGLPPRCRQMLSMLVSDPPYSYADISATLGIPIGSIGPQRARCLDLLRRAMTLGPSGDEPGSRGGNPLRHTGGAIWIPSCQLPPRESAALIRKIKRR